MDDTVQPTSARLPTAERYDHRNRSEITLDEARAQVGKDVTLPLTGKLVDCGVSAAGVWVKFEVDERWGMPPGLSLTMDLDCFFEVPE
jgi:hypothetical protein